MRQGGGLLTRATVAALGIWCALATGAIAGTVLPERSPILEPPGSDVHPTDVAIGLHIINIASIDEVAETFQIDGYLLMRWKDARLEFQPAGPDDHERHYAPGQIWVPKIEMINAASPRDKYDISIAVSPEGVVNYAERCKAVLSSKFELRRFPFDAQTLAIIMHPFVSNSHNVGFSLNDHKTWMSSELETYSSLAQWRLRKVTPLVGSTVIYDGSRVAEIRFSISVKRRSNFYIWKVILPLLLMVVLSWAAFWIEASDLQNQLQVAVTTILTVIAFAFAISSTMPRVPYLTYIDAFFLQCYVFVFLAIVELMTVHMAHRTDRRRDLGLRIRRLSRWSVPAAFVISNLILIMHFLT